MSSGRRGSSSFEDVERFDRSNFVLFRQWERRSASARQTAFWVAVALTLVLLVVVVGGGLASGLPHWASSILALGAIVAVFTVFYRRSLRFSSLIVAREFVVWETQCSQTWRRSFRFRHLDLPFPLAESPLVIPVDEMTGWSVQEDEQSDETGLQTGRLVLWRGTNALETFFVPSRDRAISLEKEIRTAVERLNPGEVGRRRTVLA